MKEKSVLDQKLEEITLSRRSFLKWSAVLGGAAALASKPGFGLKAIEAAVQFDELSGTWKPFRCFDSSCEATCIAYGLVKDGKVTRIKTDNNHAGSMEYPLQKSCLRGWARRSFVYSVDRLKYPMKRKNWEPGGGKKELRGKDEWVRISWDEAIDLAATEMKRIKETYGNQAIINYKTSGHTSLLSKFGGFSSGWGMLSCGGWITTHPNMTGKPGYMVFYDEHSSNDRFDLLNSKLIVLWGLNPAWSALGGPNNHYLEAKKAGAKIISIDPFFNNTASSLVDEWIPVRPATDTALLLAIAYEMIVNDLQDQEFLDKYTVGFDADHMPEGADPKENFKDYVLGTYDGQPKSPAWAAKICGVEENTIRKFAVEFATTKPAAILTGGGPARARRGEQFCQAFLTVGWMTGNVGIPGGQVSDTYGNKSVNGGPVLVKAGSRGKPKFENPIPISITYDDMWDAIINKECILGGNTVPTDIRMIWDIGSGNFINQLPGTNRAIEAYRTVDFVLAADYFMTTKMKYADIVLPSTTNWESYDHLAPVVESMMASHSNNKEVLTYTSQLIDPLFEAKSDQWMEEELAKKLGLDPDELFISSEQQFYNQIAGSLVMKDDASGYEPLFTITADDVKEIGAVGEPQTGRMDFQEFKKTGIYQVERHKGDNFGYIAFKDFRDDPEANPLKTPSGKLQIHSAALSGTMAYFGGYQVAPIAQYVPPDEGYEDTFENFETGEKGEYPLQLITPHYVGRMHSTLDNVSILKEAFPHEVWLNPATAEQYGIEHGNGVKVESRHGAVLRTAKVSARLVPGVVLIGEGGWLKRDDDTMLDRGGCANSLVGVGYDNKSGIQSYNTTNVKIEKYNDLVPDCRMDPEIPEWEGENNG